MDSAPGLPLSSADGECALSVGTGEIVIISSEICAVTVAGPVTITSLPALGVGDSILPSFGATKTCVFPILAIIPVRDPSEAVVEGACSELLQLLRAGLVPTPQQR